VSGRSVRGGARVGHDVSAESTWSDTRPFLLGETRAGPSGRGCGGLAWRSTHQ
jgi:cbb3-type cytochrome oxidase cytochrome c subunit